MSRRHLGQVKLSDTVTLWAWQRPSRRARRLSLRLDPTGTEVWVSTPARVSATEARVFMTKHQNWIARQVAALPPWQNLAPGETVTVLGEKHILSHDGSLRGRAWQDGASLRAGGADDAAFVRRVEAFVKARVREAALTHLRTAAGVLGVPIPALALRDTHSRWGSCASTGRIMLSWRLGYAPPEVLRYVTMHEAAHLQEANHSPAFWALVGKLDPHWQASRCWLRQNGRGLLRIGFRPGAAAPLAHAPATAYGAAQSLAAHGSP